MKTSLLAATLLAAFAFTAPSAFAAGCLKGAAVGGIAGHLAHHHGLLGAAAGCAVGEHHAKQKEAQQAAR